MPPYVKHIISPNRGKNISCLQVTTGNYVKNNCTKEPYSQKKELLFTEFPLHYILRFCRRHCPEHFQGERNWNPHVVNFNSSTSIAQRWLEKHSVFVHWNVVENARELKLLEGTLPTPNFVTKSAVEQNSVYHSHFQ